MNSPVERELRRAVFDAVPVPSAEAVEKLVAEGAPPAPDRVDLSFKQAPGLFE